MSSSISSTEVVSTAVTTYAWAGGTNASPSIERVNGVETRRNYGTAASVTNLGTASSVSAQTWKGEQWSAFSATSDGNAIRHSIATAGISTGTRIRAAIRVGNPGAASVQVSVDVGDALEVLVAIPAGEERTIMATGAPTSASLQFVDVSARTSNVTILIKQLVAEVGVDAAGPYFDGATPGRTVTSYALSRPLQVLGYESQRASGNVFHDVIGRANPDVTLRPAGLRTGTLSYLFGSEADAAECERMHSGTAVLTLDDPELPTIAMPYVADGAISRQLDPQSRALWLVGVAYREVRP